MSDVTESLKELVRTLRTERDELNVKLNLAKLELRDQWERAEQRWDHLEDKLEDVGQEAAHSAGLIAREIEQAYQRLRDTIKQ